MPFYGETVGSRQVRKCNYDFFIFDSHYFLEKEIPLQLYARPLLKETAARLRQDEKSEQKAVWVFGRSPVHLEAPKNALFEIESAK